MTPAADAPVPAAPPAPPVVRAGSRIAWDQPVLDGTDVADYRFALVAGRVRVPLEGARCEEGRPLWPAACSAPLPSLDRGRHGLAVIALGLGARGRESRPSPTIEIDVP